MLVLALDVGTSSTRASCFDAAGRPLPEAEGRVGYAARVAPDGEVVLEPDTLVDAVASAVDQALAGARAPAREIAGVGASVFWHSLLALDDARRPLLPVLTWADTRSAEAAAELRARLDGAAVHARTGALLHASYYPARLRWLRERHADLFARATVWCGFAEYLLWRLTGVLRASVSMASGTGLFDQDRVAWDVPLLAESAIDAARLPPVDDAPAPGLTPEWAARWPALARVPWFPGWGDGACSNLGSDAAGPDRIALNVGTSAALRLVLSDVPTVPKGLWRYRIDAERALVGGATSEGGNVLTWCRELLALPDGDALERRLATRAPDEHGLTVLPFLAGERSPGWRGDARATITGLSLATDALDIGAALLEAVALRLSIVHERLAPLAAANHRVIASGGALLHSPAWARMIADAFGRPLTLSREAEASSRGAALRVLEALGAPPPPPAPLGAPVTPDPTRHAAFRAARDRQQRLYDNVVGSPLS
jgi:gluconokinase